MLWAEMPVCMWCICVCAHGEECICMWGMACVCMWVCEAWVLLPGGRESTLSDIIYLS